MKKLMFLAAVAATAIVAGCSDNATGNQPVQNESDAINFRTIVDKGVSRASLVENIAGLNSFFLEAAAGTATALDFMSTAVYKDGTDWVYAPKKYFPTNGDAVKFFAYAPIKDQNMTGQALSYDGTDASFDYTLSAAQNAANTSTDLLVASAQADNTATGEVVLDFNHALSAVMFSAVNTNDVDDFGELTYVIEEIAITNLLPEGTFTYPFSATSWAASGTAVNFLAGIPAAGVSLVSDGTTTRKSLLSTNDYMMVIPQATVAGTATPGATPSDPVTVTGNMVKVKYSLKDGSGTVIVDSHERCLPLPAGFAFAAGQRYNFAFDFSTEMAGAEALVEIIFDVTLTDWINTPDTVIVEP